MIFLQEKFVRLPVFWNYKFNDSAPISISDTWESKIWRIKKFVQTKSFGLLILDPATAPDLSPSHPLVPPPHPAASPSGGRTRLKNKA